MPPQIRVMVAEDDPLAQHALENYLARAADMELVGVAADGEAAIALAHEQKPDVSIVDIHMPKLDGIAVTEALTASPLSCRVVCFTALGDDATLHRAIAAGASGFLLKADNPGLVIHAVRSAYSGDALVSPKLVATVLRENTRHHSEPPEFLSAGDRELLGHIGNGLSNAEIAARMFLAPSTVKTYVSRLLARLGKPNRAALAALAYEWRLVLD